jgi:hypothetical protein
MQYDFALTPLGGQIINAKGRFFKYRAGTGLIRVKLTDGAVIDLLPGQGVSNRNFESIEITDKSGAINTGTILAGDFDFRDERITGTVDVVDGGKSRTLANSSFMLQVPTPVVAGQLSHAQLFNPASSGKNVMVEAITYAADTANTGVFVFMHNVQLANFMGAGQSKKLGGQDAVAKGYSSTNVGAVNANLNLMGVNIPQGTPITYRPTEPIIIAPGFGLVMRQAINGVGLTANFEWYEEPL